MGGFPAPPEFVLPLTRGSPLRFRLSPCPKAKAPVPRRKSAQQPDARRGPALFVPFSSENGGVYGMSPGLVLNLEQPSPRTCLQIDLGVTKLQTVVWCRRLSWPLGPRFAPAPLLTPQLHTRRTKNPRWMAASFCGPSGRRGVPGFLCVRWPRFCGLWPFYWRFSYADPTYPVHHNFPPVISAKNRFHPLGWASRFFFLPGLPSIAARWGFSLKTAFPKKHCHGEPRKKKNRKQTTQLGFYHVFPNRDALEFPAPSGPPGLGPPVWGGQHSWCPPAPSMLFGFILPRASSPATPLPPIKSAFPFFFVCCTRVMSGRTNRPPGPRRPLVPPTGRSASPPKAPPPPVPPKIGFCST